MAPYGSGGKPVLLASHAFHHGLYLFGKVRPPPKIHHRKSDRKIAVDDDSVPGGSEREAEIVSLRPGKPDARTYQTTIINNSRRYSHQACPHRGPFLIDRKLAVVECQDCGSLLNPIYCLEVLANREAYWNMRQRDLGKYLAEINAEIADRTRTKCTHCGNMTAIKFKREMPRTWTPTDY